MEEFTEQEFGFGRRQKRAHNKKQRGQMKHYLQRVSIEFCFVLIKDENMENQYLIFAMIL